MNLSDVDLIQLWQRGDEAAFETLYKRHASRLLSLALAKTGDRAVSEEFVNDAFVKFFQLKARASAITSVEAYLSTIVRNKILDHYRHLSVQKKYEEFRAMRHSDFDFSTVNELEAKALRDLIDLDVARLPLKCRTVFKLSKFGSLSNKEIAQVMDISENTVEQHMRKALRLLRSSIISYGAHSAVLLTFVKEVLK